MDDALPEYMTHGFTAIDTFPTVPSRVRVVIYYDHGINMYLVDIQKWLGDKWREELDPFRSTNEEDCLEYYDDLKNDDTYTDVEVLRGT